MAGGLKGFVMDLFKDNVFENTTWTNGIISGNHTGIPAYHNLFTGNVFKNAYADLNFRPLLEMDVSKLDCGDRMNTEKVKSIKRYTAWIKKYKKGRVFYCSPSHNAESLR